MDLFRLSLASPPWYLPVAPRSRRSVIRAHRIPVHTGLRMKHWLLKSEPAEFSIDALQRVGVEPWSGVRNYQARNHLRAMHVGDTALFYHSSCAEPGVVGIARVVRAAYPDPTQFDPRSDYHDPKSSPDAPRWSAVDVAFERKLAHPIGLPRLREHAQRLGEFALLARGNRLSVLPVSKAQWTFLLTLA